METRAGVRERRVVDETDLLEALRHGDQDAFAALVDANSPWMMRLARSYVSTRASAEDVVQEAWLRCLRGLEGFQARSSLRTWLFAIVTNCSLRRAERDARSVPFSELARREAASGEPEPLEDRFFDASHPRWANCWSTFSPPWDGLPEDRLLAGEVAARIEAAASRLPEAQRTVFLLRDVEGWSSEDVCNALEISGSNQRVLLHRARHAVRSVLEDYLEQGEPQ
jgi:RNA polymerase sigma-70 factor (ECF subfamily)